MEVMSASKNKKEETESGFIGPALPPHLLKINSEDEEATEDSPQSETAKTAVIGPSLPPQLLKSTFKNDSPDTEENEGTSEEQCFGPQLPPHLLNKKFHSEESSHFGPQIPSHLRQKLQEENSSQLEVTEDDDEIYGPLPVGETSSSKGQIALEERALQLKMDQLGPSQEKAPVREEWMLELPEVRASSLGLGPRQFRSKAYPDFSDRSSWTDTPNKVKKDEVDLKKETEIRDAQRRDEEQEKVAKKHKKKNKESLLELHQTEMKKRKKEEGPSERRPFSRDIDLKVNRFDEAQKKAVLKKAQLLDNRFSSGQSKYL